MNSIVVFFSKNIAEVISTYLNSNSLECLEEIRIRTSKPLILKTISGEVVFEYIVKPEDVINSLEKICENSVYTYQNQICHGFITVKGGHRVGITGNAVIENEKIININYIAGLNFRVAKQILDCSNSIIRYVTEIETNTVKNTLIVSAPGARKNYNTKGFSAKNQHGFYFV